MGNKQWKRFLQDVTTLNPIDQAAMTQLWRVRDELSTDDNGLVLRSRCIVIPKALWGRVVELAHQGHQGIAKTKAKLRSKIWFLGMDKMVDKNIRHCHSCLITSDDCTCQKRLRLTMANHFKDKNLGTLWHPSGYDTRKSRLCGHKPMGRWNDSYIPLTRQYE